LGNLKEKEWKTRKYTIALYYIQYYILFTEEVRERWRYVYRKSDCSQEFTHYLLIPF